MTNIPTCLTFQFDIIWLNFIHNILNIFPACMCGSRFPWLFLVLIITFSQFVWKLLNQWLYVYLHSNSVCHDEVILWMLDCWFNRCVFLSCTVLYDNCFWPDGLCFRQPAGLLLNDLSHFPVSILEECDAALCSAVTGAQCFATQQGFSTNSCAMTLLQISSVPPYLLLCYFKKICDVWMSNWKQIYFEDGN